MINKFLISSDKKSCIIYGPTASGKSKVAMELADFLCTKNLIPVIVNADSRQVYKGLDIITASPSNKDKIAYKHYLYNYVSITEHYSVGRYLRDLQLILDELQSNKKIFPIIVGGTGMYISSILNGLSAIPKIDTNIKDLVANALSSIGLSGIYAKLQYMTPNHASTISTNDLHRVCRAYEVFLQTGKCISEFHAIKSASILQKDDVYTIYVNPPRESVYDNCGKRLVNMFQTGAIDEVVALNNDERNIAQKILGVPEIIALLSREMSLEEAITRATTKTRQYVKRQNTWFNNQTNFLEPSLTIVEC